MTTVALAGRRIDPSPNGTPRFPLENSALVALRIAQLFSNISAKRLVCSAACGADLLAIEVALHLGLRDVTVVLPFPPEEFRRVSVIDRPGPWGALFDALLGSDALKLDSLDLGLEATDAFEKTNLHILEHARTAPLPVCACIVSEGKARDGIDHTFSLQQAASAMGWPVHSVSTLR